VVRGPQFEKRCSRTHGQALVQVYFSSVVCVCVFFLWGFLLLQPEEFGSKFGGDNFETP